MAFTSVRKWVGVQGDVQGDTLRRLQMAVALPAGMT